MTATKITPGLITSVAGVAGLPTASVVQVKNVSTSTQATGTAQIAWDGSIPQISEGTEFFTLAITPTSATNKLFINVNARFNLSNNYPMNAAIFQDSTANALVATTTNYAVSTTHSTMTAIMTLFMTAGTTSETTFKFRAGSGTSLTYIMNGRTSYNFGGVNNSSMTIMEITP